MKKTLALVVSIAFMSSLLTSPALGAVKAGASCTKAGSTSIASGKKFTCVKFSKKLVWNKGVAVKAKTPAPTQSKTPSVSFPDSWPLDKPADENLVLIADASVRKYISDSTKLPTINLLTGPKTDRISATNYLRYLEKAATGWGKDWMPDQVDVAMGQVEDFDWIKPLWKQYGLDGGGFDNSESTWRRNGADCNQGSAIYDKVPFFWGCLPKNQSIGIGLDKFGPHEYMHLVQYGIIYYQSGKRVRNFPYLLSEGSADFYGVTYASTADTAKQNWKTYWVNGYFSPSAKSDLKSANNEEIESLLMDAMRLGIKAPGHWSWTGAYVTARLVAAKGHEGFVAYMRKTGETGDVFKSFDAVYGMSFEKFVQIIAPEIKSLTLNLRG
jgi:hypothetical protein